MMHPISLLVVVLLWLSQLAPGSRWTPRYWEIAAAVADASEDAPLFAGDLGPLRTAALLVAVAHYEARGFKPDARGSAGELGLWQVHPVHHLDPKALVDPRRAAPIARELMRQSLRECSQLPQDERLALFTSGDCGRGRAESAHRVRLARWLAGDLRLPTGDAEEPTAAR